MGIIIFCNLLFWMKSLQCDYSVVIQLHFLHLWCLKLFSCLTRWSQKLSAKQDERMFLYNQSRSRRGFSHSGSREIYKVSYLSNSCSFCSWSNLKWPQEKLDVGMYYHIFQMKDFCLNLSPKICLWEWFCHISQKFSSGSTNCWIQTVFVLMTTKKTV